MKWRKLMDGVYEGESFKPEPHAEYDHSSYGHDWARRTDGTWPRLAARLRLTVPNAVKVYEANYHFPTTYGAERYQWHEDGTMSGASHVLVMICCDNPALGTVFKRPDGTTFQGKTWTPYLFGSNVTHASPLGPWSHERWMYRQFFKLDEATLPVVAT